MAKTNKRKRPHKPRTWSLYDLSEDEIEEEWDHNWPGIAPKMTAREQKEIIDRIREWVVNTIDEDMYLEVQSVVDNIAKQRRKKADATNARHPEPTTTERDGEHNGEEIN